jgi:D-hydroxyproline dehydrogenase subunit alpha
MHDAEFDVLVVGAGPAGLAAACAAAQAGKSKVGIVDETPWLGGQIWRGQDRNSTERLAAEWFGRVRQSSIQVLSQTSVIAAPGRGVLLCEREGTPYRVHWKKLVLATGARELFLPFPGWTLPGVLGPGGLLHLAKNGWPVRDKTIIVAGSGPLLLAAAGGLVKRGARVLAIYEQADWGKVARFGFGLSGRPTKLWQAIQIKTRLRSCRYVCGAWPVRVEGNEIVEQVTLTDGHKTWTEECDLFACGFGLVANTELPMLLGCEVGEGFVRVDEFQTTSIPDVYCAGEVTGVRGAESALVEGQIAGNAAAGAKDKAKDLFGARASWHQFGAALARTFALRPELAGMAEEDTIVCRCEDVPMARLREFKGWREAKLHTRCGMGACQGRVCGPAAKVLLGWNATSVRPPVAPAKIESLIGGR